MTTLPEEAVKAAMAAHNKYYDDLVIYPSEEPTPEGAFHAALKGALPFLSVQGAVKKLKWNEYNDEQGIPDRWDAEASSFGVFYSIEIQHDGYRVVFDHEAVGAVGVFDTLEAAKAAAQADYEARVMSAIETGIMVSQPSAARELHGPFGYIVGRRDLREDEWSLENDPVNEEDATNGFFSVPLYALTDPFKEIGIDCQANGASPSARELALEEVHGDLIKRLNDDIAQLTNMVSQAAFAGAETGVRVKSPSILLKDLCDAVDAIRTLSSPDHADAGKVEGYGWRPIESAPHNEKVLLSWKDCLGEWTFEVFEASWGWRTDTVSNVSTHGKATHWRHLPSAPSEGAE